MCENVCKNCPYQYYVGKKYHSQLIKILWILAKYLLRKLSITDIFNLNDEIVKLQNVYESEET